jgi:hypothetical protein
MLCGQFRGWGERSEWLADGRVAVNVEVIEYEVVCSDHGRHKMLVPERLPRPSRCPHCFLPLVSRREICRSTARLPLPGLARPETWVG